MTAWVKSSISGTINITSPRLGFCRKDNVPYLVVVSSAQGGKNETKEFLEKVLGDGYYSVLGLGDKKVQSFHATIDDVIKKANELDAEGINAYFGLATFETDKDRRVTNVKSLSSFYLDLDCGVGKEYPDQNTAF